MGKASRAFLGKWEGPSSLHECGMSLSWRFLAGHPGEGNKQLAPEPEVGMSLLPKSLWDLPLDLSELV